MRRKLLIITCVLLPALASSQTDTATTRQTYVGKFLRQSVQRLKRTPQLNDNSSYHGRSEDAFDPYEGKVIRNIELTQYGFERTFNDTSRIEYLGTKILNTLHNDTKGWVISDNLFFRKNSRLNSYRLADNERFLRQLSFIQDARIVVCEIGDGDSVDIEVITKDLFSITGSFIALRHDKWKINFRDDNLAGMGQRLQLTSLYEKRRVPSFGYEALYTKYNLFGSFINATVAYTGVNNSANGFHEEESVRLTFDKPLVSRFSKFAGSATIGRSLSRNLYETPEDRFYRYRTDNYDLYFGYNLDAAREGVKKPYQRTRHFLGLRYSKTSFIEQPYQFIDQFAFKTGRSILGQFTFFEQDFYKTQYIYGFGTTEDLPYGFNLSFVGGSVRQWYLERPYAGVNFSRHIKTPGEDFVQFFARAGAFTHQDKWQDAAVMLGVSGFSRLFTPGSYKVRHFIRLSYARIYNRYLYMPLMLGNPYGIRNFNQSPMGDQRLSLNTETSVFFPGKVMGFQFCPFVFSELSLLTPPGQPFEKTPLYSGIGGGVRTRNENFAFGTIELRISWFPREANSRDIKIFLRSNIRYRYRSTYVNAPEILQLNAE